jgi:putative flavoprotein involved in K+ transport
MSATQVVDVLVIGAGQAGLGVSYYLQKAGIDHRVLERGLVAETWRSQRWNSFALNTPNEINGMPGSPYDGPNPQGFFSRDEFIDLLEGYSIQHRLPVETRTTVAALDRDPRGNGFRICTPNGTFQAGNVIIATGDRNVPTIPKMSVSLPAGIVQIHTADYRTADSLPPGSVLVIGGAQSGCQIVEDLIDSGRTVYLSTSRVGRVPRRYRGRDIMAWNRDTGRMDEKTEELADSSIKYRAQQQLSGTNGGHTVSLQWLSSKGVVLLGRLKAIRDAKLTFDDDLEENIRFADETSAAHKRRIDEYVAHNRLDVPAAEPDPAETVTPRIPSPPILGLDLATSGISTVIWRTGFGGCFDWVHLPVFDAQGRPEHVRGVTRSPGVYFAGLRWLSKRKSGLIAGIDEDSKYLVSHIVVLATSTRHWRWGNPSAGGIDAIAIAS